MKSYVAFTLALGMLVNPLGAQDKPDLTDPRQKTSYALGIDIVSTLQRNEADLDIKVLAAGMADTFAGQPGLTADQQKTAMAALSKELEVKVEERIKVAAAQNLKAGQAFLAANASKDGVKVLPVTAPDGSTAELQYQILKSGTGPSPKKSDAVEVHYIGSLIDGTVFDSSVKRGIPATFLVTAVIPGWTAALQMMKAGDKWRLFIPPSLGYGASGPPQIGPNTTVIYDLELLSFYPPVKHGAAATNATATLAN